MGAAASAAALGEKNVLKTSDGLGIFPRSITT